jgi:hypothetical protein
MVTVVVTGADAPFVTDITFPAPSVAAYGTCRVIWLGLTYTSGAGTPSTVAVTVPSVVSANPSLSASARMAGVEGPMSAPNNVINSPGLTAPGCILAALTTL